MTQHVPPAQTSPARLQPLAKLPIFLDLAERKAVVVGGGDPTVWKAELLAAAGAKVEVFAENPSSELLALVATAPAMTLTTRRWMPDDLNGAAIAVAEAEGEEAVRFVAAARSRGAVVNIIDQPNHCDFQFGAIVNRSPVVIGISTDGAAPILSQAIRRQIEAILPASLGSWARSVKTFREQLAALVPSKAGRRRFWERFVDISFISQAEEDEQLAAIERLAREARWEEPKHPEVGEVVIVGAGPGDPELLTMRAVRELQAADVIVYDRLVTPGILELARREARRIHVGKQGHGEACRQEDISALLVDLALEGKRVVRLKGGDPTIFGRAGEEVEACEAAHLPVRIVPGVTTATAAAAALGLSLTHRDHAQRLQFVTGHDRHGRLPPTLDLDAMADPAATTVIYMGRRTAAPLAEQLIARGLPAATPAIVITNVSLPSEVRRHTTLAELGGTTEGGGAQPTIILIGTSFRKVTSRLETASRNQRSSELVVP